jgi:voltage-gated potassium channel
MGIFLRIIKKIFVKSSNQSIVRVILFALVLNFIFGVLFYFAERSVQPDLSFWDAIWWAMVTMTTVGYGDFYAQTFLGRFLISYPCMLLGIGIIGYLVGVVAERMLEHGSKKRKGLLEVKMKNHIIICNYPGDQKILRLKDELSRSRRYGKCALVLVTNSLDELTSELSQNGIVFVKGDPTREDILMKAHIIECAGVFILAEDIDDPASDTKTFAIGTQIEMIEKEINKPIKVIVEMVSKSNFKMMRRSMVDSIVSADGIMDVLVAQEFLYPGLHDVFHEILSNQSGSQFYIFDNKFGGDKFGDIQKKAVAFDKNVQVLGIKRNNSSVMNPDKNEVLNASDQLIVLANSVSDFEMFETSALQNFDQEV